MAEFFFVKTSQQELITIYHLQVWAKLIPEPWEDNRLSVSSHVFFDIREGQKSSNAIYLQSV